MPGITQTYRSWLKVDASNVVPVLPGTRLSYPKNWQLPPMMHALAWELNAVEGMQYPVLTGPAVVCANWFTAANLNAWFVNRAGDDLAALTDGVEFYDGASGGKLVGAKGGRFSLGAGFGQLVNCQLAFWGAAPANVGADPSPVVATPTASQHCQFAGLASNPVSWNLVLDNGLTPNPEFPNVYNQVNPVEINAGRMTVRGQLVFQAHHTLPTDGGSFSIYVKPPGAGNFVKITLINPLYTAPHDRQVQAPRQYRSLDFIGLAAANGLSAPVAFAASASVP